MRVGPGVELAFLRRGAPADEGDGMIVPPAGVRVPIATRPVDFHRGADGLAATVQTMLRQDPCRLDTGAALFIL